MKYRCVSQKPVAVMIEGNLVIVSEGQVIDVPTKPQGKFEVVDVTPKPVKKTVKKTPKKVIKNANTTETSSVW